MSILVGDTVYLSAFTGSSGHELWAHDTSNHSTWQVAEINTAITWFGGLGSYPGQYMAVPLGDTIYFSADDGSTGYELWAHRPSRIDYNTNTGGAVASWAISASLPSGVSFDTVSYTHLTLPTKA